MAFITYFFCIALLCGARASPLGQTVCETIPNVYPFGPSLPLPVSNVGTTTVCESSPSLGLGIGYPSSASVGLGIGLPYPSLPLPVPNVGSTTVCETSPNLGRGIGYPYQLNYGYLPYSYPYSRYPVSCWDNLGYYPYNTIPSTTVCETSPNVVGILPRPSVGNVGSTTVCESSPNLVGIRPFPNAPVPNVGATTVCETTSNILPCNGLPLPYPGLLPGYAPIGMPFL